jgi:hypothetical protein
MSQKEEKSPATEEVGRVVDAPGKCRVIDAPEKLHQLLA